jgi:hypothetical protein
MERLLRRALFGGGIARERRSKAARSDDERSATSKAVAASIEDFKNELLQSSGPIESTASTDGKVDPGKSVRDEPLSYPGSRNWILNPSGAYGLAGWTEHTHRANLNLWKVEPSDIPVDDATATNFVSSYYWCIQSQSVPLSPILRRPARIEVSCRFMGRADCPSVFCMTALVVGHSGRILQRVATPQLDTISDGWETARLEFPDAVDPGRAHSVVVVIAGKDRRHWAGNFGAKAAGCSVRVLGDNEDVDQALQPDALEWLAGQERRVAVSSDAPLTSAKPGQSSPEGNPISRGILERKALDKLYDLILNNPGKLLERGEDGYLPLHVAVAHNASLEVVRLLGKEGPEALLEKTMDGALPLHLAGRTAPLEVVKFLVEEWPDSLWVRTGRSWLATKLGDRPVDVARKNKNVDVANWLQEAMEDQKDKAKQKPVDQINNEKDITCTRPIEWFFPRKGSHYMCQVQNEHPSLPVLVVAVPLAETGAVHEVWEKSLAMKARPTGDASKAEDKLYTGRPSIKMVQPGGEFHLAVTSNRVAVYLLFPQQGQYYMSKGTLLNVQKDNLVIKESDFFEGLPNVEVIFNADFTVTIQTPKAPSLATVVPRAVPTAVTTNLRVVPAAAAGAGTAMERGQDGQADAIVRATTTGSNEPANSGPVKKQGPAGSSNEPPSPVKETPLSPSPIEAGCHERRAFGVIWDLGIIRQSFTDITGLGILALQVPYFATLFLAVALCLCVVWRDRWRRTRGIVQDPNSVTTTPGSKAGATLSQGTSDPHERGQGKVARGSEHVCHDPDPASANPIGQSLPMGKGQTFARSDPKGDAQMEREKGITGNNWFGNKSYVCDVHNEHDSRVLVVAIPKDVMSVVSEVCRWRLGLTGSCAGAAGGEALGEHTARARRVSPRQASISIAAGLTKQLQVERNPTVHVSTFFLKDEARRLYYMSESNNIHNVRTCNFVVPREGSDFSSAPVVEVTHEDGKVSIRSVQRVNPEVENLTAPRRRSASKTRESQNGGKGRQAQRLESKNGGKGRQAQRQRTGGGAG